MAVMYNLQVLKLKLAQLLVKEVLPLE